MIYQQCCCYQRLLCHSLVRSVILLNIMEMSFQNGNLQRSKFISVVAEHYDNEQNEWLIIVVMMELAE